MSLKWEAFRHLYFMIFLAYHLHNNNYYASGKPKKSIIIIIITDIINIQKKRDNFPLTVLQKENLDQCCRPFPGPSLASVKDRKRRLSLHSKNQDLTE